MICLIFTSYLCIFHSKFSEYIFLRQSFLHLPNQEWIVGRGSARLISSFIFILNLPPKTDFRVKNEVKHNFKRETKQWMNAYLLPPLQLIVSFPVNVRKPDVCFAASQTCLLLLFSTNYNIFYQGLQEKSQISNLTCILYTKNTE